ncbi:MAG TPA: NAD(P)-binding domain-containing protein, partial [Pyrinomonadaceae bacterium]|nr:NAD(P)-binding domain-containing protein [Pyrinomonadaceae bacterium]
MARDKKTRRSTHPHKQNAHDGGDGKVKTPRSVASSPNTRTAHALATRPTVAIIGAGRLGSALAIALGECGYNVAALVSRRAAHAKRAARATNSQTLALGASQLNLISATDLL